MSQEFDRLIGRAVGDKKFRDALLDNPEEAAKKEGINLSADEMKQLKDGIEKIKSDMSSEQIDKTFGVAGSGWHS